MSDYEIYDTSLSITLCIWYTRQTGPTIGIAWIDFVLHNGCFLKSKIPILWNTVLQSLSISRYSHGSVPDPTLIKRMVYQMMLDGPLETRLGELGHFVIINVILVSWYQWDRSIRKWRNIHCEYIIPYSVNTLWPIDAILSHRSGSTLIQILVAAWQYEVITWNNLTCH